MPGLTCGTPNDNGFGVLVYANQTSELVMQDSDLHRVRGRAGEHDIAPAAQDEPRRDSELLTDLG
jgi:hypothetical protein